MMYFPTVFVGSSSAPRDDVITYRQAAKDAVLDAQMTPLMFEHYARQYTSGTPLKLSEDMIDAADIFLGFYTGTYGRAISDTRDWAEFEYDYAHQQNKRMVLFFAADADTRNPTVDERASTFKQKIGSRTFYQTFTDAADLRSQITTILSSPQFKGTFKNHMITAPRFGTPQADGQYDMDVFMIMPFRDELTAVYQDVILPTVEALGLTIKRGDNFNTDVPIMSDVWAAINHARVIIADCTGNNPNVFYELGIAHTLGKKTLLLVQNIDDVPFDIQPLRQLVYTPDDLDALRRQLTSDLPNLLD